MSHALNIIPNIAMTETELAVAAEHMAQPVVQKYLRMLSYDNAAAIITGSPKDGETSESYLLREAAVKGRLDVLATLLSIQAAQPE